MNISLSSTQARPGFQVRYFIDYHNSGSIIENGTIFLKHDPNLNLVSSAPPFVSYTNDSASWTYTGLIPGETRTLEVLLDVPSTVPINTILTSVAKIFPVLGDTFPQNNTDSLNHLVTGSYDPNFKEVQPPDSIVPMSTDTLEFTIHFQNTGNDTAFNITIRDSIDSKLLQSSMRLLGSSDPCEFSIQNGVITFVFDNILLPDSGTNESESHGLLKYSMTVNSSLITPGSIVRNKAYIYFDFNFPITTNNTYTEFLNIITSDGSPNFELLDKSNFILFPNPNTGEFQILAPSGVSAIGFVYDITGRELFRCKLNEGYNSIRMENSSPGMFIIKISEKDKGDIFLRMIVD